MISQRQAETKVPNPEGPADPLNGEDPARPSSCA
jgi:hypothetical protein